MQPIICLLDVSLHLFFFLINAGKCHIEIAELWFFFFDVFGWLQKISVYVIKLEE